jgi:predicted DNA-binding transcriptional regulator AlpA
MKRKIELSVETEKITLRGPLPAISWCRECDKPSMRITSEQAALLAGVSEMLIYRTIEAGRLHHSETADGRLRICMASLASVAWEESAIRNDQSDNDSLDRK